MDIATVMAIASALVNGLPKLIAAIKAGRDPVNITLAEIISTDALAQIRSANHRAQTFIETGKA